MKMAQMSSFLSNPYSFLYQANTSLNQWHYLKLLRFFSTFQPGTRKTLGFGKNL